MPAVTCWRGLVSVGGIYKYSEKLHVSDEASGKSEASDGGQASQRPVMGPKQVLGQWWDPGKSETSDGAQASQRPVMEYRQVLGQWWGPGKSETSDGAQPSLRPVMLHRQVLGLWWTLTSVAWSLKASSPSKAMCVALYPVSLRQLVFWGRWNVYLWTPLCYFFAILHSFSQSLSIVLPVGVSCWMSPSASWAPAPSLVVHASP